MNDIKSGFDEEYNISILIADDEVHDINIIKLCLHSAGYRRIKTARNGFEALNIIKSNPIDLVLLDLNMPEMSGHDLLKLLAEDKVDIKVIVISAEGSSGKIDPSLRQQIFCYLAKPFGKKSLIESVRSLELLKHEASR